MPLKITGSAFLPAAISGAAVLVILSLGLVGASAQVPPAPVAAAALAHPLVWDSMSNTASPKVGDEFAPFKFKVTNISEEPVTILDAHGSCGCTVPQMPRNPWIMPPHTTDELVVTVNLAGKIGQFFKTVTIMPSNFPPQVLMVTVNMPDSPEAERMRNQMMAGADRQAVFKGECAQCHLEPTKGKMAKELYATACGICHDPAGHPRAAMVPNLKALNHPTDYAFWKQWIENGKPGTLMPAFSTANGGPLSSEQIESLAKVLVQVFPSRPAMAVPPGQIPAPAGAPATNAMPAVPPAPPMPVPGTVPNPAVIK